MLGYFTELSTKYQSSTICTNISKLLKVKSKNQCTYVYQGINNIENYIKLRALLKGKCGKFVLLMFYLGAVVVEGYID